MASSISYYYVKVKRGDGQVLRARAKDLKTACVLAIRFASRSSSNVGEVEVSVESVF